MIIECSPGDRDWNENMAVPQSILDDRTSMYGDRKRDCVVEIAD